MIKIHNKIYSFFRFSSFDFRLSTIIFFFILSYISKAETDTTDYLYHIGGYIHLNTNIHTAYIDSLPNVSNCCSQFSNGFGIGMSFGIEAGYPLNDRLILSGRIGYSNLYGRLDETEIQKITIDDKISDAEIEHIIEARYSLITIEPLFRYRVLAGFDALVGLSGGYLIQHEFQQWERLVKPENRGTFENGLRTRNDISGTIEKTNPILLLIFGGASYNFIPIENENLIISPEILLYQNLNSLLKTSNWFVFQPKIGLSIRYYFKPEEEKEEIELKL